MDKWGAALPGRTAALVVSVIVLLCLAAVSAPVAMAAPPGQFTRALTDDVWYDGLTPQWIPRTVSTGAKRVLLEVDWRTIEPSQPAAGPAGADPAGSQFDFAALDTEVRDFARTGISVAFLVSDAPVWAEAPGGPAELLADGAWEPSAAAYGQLARVLAERYSGSYPDPLHTGESLPRVRYFQAWAEANFTVHLAPQWKLSGRAWVPAAPAMYRSLLNAFYAGVKSVHSNNFVITTGFGPYGDPSPGACTNDETGNGCRTSPALFAREMLCLHGETLRTERCPAPAHFDALAMDPYEVSSPTTPAVNPDDVSAPDLWKLSRMVTKAVHSGRALPRGNKQLWVTEFSYDSNPPNPTAVSLATQARWLEEALYLFWKQGVSTVVWYLIRDQTSTYNQVDYYSGLYYYNGRPKPAFEAFRFPLVVWPAGRLATVWGVSPQTGRLAIQQRSGRGWSTLFRFRIAAGGVFARSISAAIHGSFRAVVNGESSVVWRG